MLSAYIREQKRYTQAELCVTFGSSEEHMIKLLRRLKRYGLVKNVKASKEQRDMSDLLEEDVEVADVEVGGQEVFYVFTFVGIVISEGYVLKCYPKYLTRSEQPKTELKQVLKVLEKYNAKDQVVRMFNDGSEESSFNLLSVLLFFLQDYYENGIYNNTENVYERNGAGEILWNKTINETFTLIYNNRPYYIDLWTRKRKTDDYDFFKRLHECVLTLASKELEEADLLDLFEMAGVELSDAELEDFGDADYILYRIEKELSVQFNTRKQLVLKMMYSYIAKGGNLQDEEGFSLFGTDRFHKIWEDVCAYILNNQLDAKLKDLTLPVPLAKEYSQDAEKKLIEIIEKPFWSITEKTTQDTLIPDLITLANTTGGYRFVIFDAKYYCARLEPGRAPLNQPGIESVTKQYFYQLAYQEFIKRHKFISVENCFLMPVEGDQVISKGEVSMEMLSQLGLENIKVRLLPAATAFDYYLADEKINIEFLNL